MKCGDEKEVVFNLGDKIGEYRILPDIVFWMVIFAINFFFLFNMLHEPQKGACFFFIFFGYLDLIFLLNYFLGCERITLYEDSFEVQTVLKTECIKFSDISYLKVVRSPFNDDFDLVWQTKGGRKRRCIYSGKTGWGKSFDEEAYEFLKKFNEQLNKHGIFLTLFEIGK